MALTTSQIVQETDISGVITSAIATTGTTTFTAVLKDSKTGVSRTPQSTTLLWDIDKDNASHEQILMTSHTTTAGVTTFTIDTTNGRNIPKYGTGAGSNTGIAHVVGASIGCVASARPLNVIANEACSKSGDTLSGNYNITGNIGLTGNVIQTGNITQTGDNGITGALTISTPLAVPSGGTGSSTAGGARSNLSAAKNGANSDITSLSGLTTPLTVAQGGMGAATHTSKAILIGNGDSAIAEIAVGSSGQTIVSDGTEWKAGSAPAGGAAALLDATQRTDTTTAAVVAGDLIYGNATPKWDRLAKGAAGSFLRMNSGATAPAWDITYTCPRYVFSTNEVAAYNFYVFGGGTNVANTYSNAYYNYSVIATSNILEWYGSTVTVYELYGMYTEGATEYLIDRNAASNGLERLSAAGAGRAAVTINGDVPTSYTACKAFDYQNNYILLHDASNSDTIRRYTVSGTTITNIASNITLSVAPTAAYSMYCDATYIYVVDVVAGDSLCYLRRYDKTTGTLVSSLKIGSSERYPMIGQDTTTYELYIRPSMHHPSYGYHDHIYKFAF